MKNYTDLHPDQLDCINFINDGEDSLICADVGTGKTVISLMSMMTAIFTKEVKRWLVLAPQMVATDTWPQEIEEWEQFRGLKLAVACGAEKQRIQAIESDAEIVVINYENLQWLMNRYPRPKKGQPETLPFDGLVCDEIDKLKAVNTERFKAFRNRIGAFNKRIGLTGTLTPNNLLEIWCQVYLIDGGESFGKSFYKWRAEYFYPIDFNQYKWVPFPDTEEKIVEKLSDLVFRLPAVGLPEVVLMPPAVLKMPESIKTLYKQLSKNFYLELEEKNLTVEAANEAGLGNKLQQICAGFLYADFEDKEKVSVWHSEARFEWLDQVILKYKDCQMLIFYHFNAERDELKRRYPGVTFLGTGVQARKQIKNWNEGNIQLMALHPASAGHGLNLQKSGAHHIIFLTLPWSGGMYKQVVGRLARRGQTKKKIYVHTAQFKNTIDSKVFDVVTGKLGRMEAFLDVLKTTARSPRT